MLQPLTYKGFAKLTNTKMQTSSPFSPVFSNYCFTCVPVFLKKSLIMFPNMLINLLILLPSVWKSEVIYVYISKIWKTIPAFVLKLVLIHSEIIHVIILQKSKVLEYILKIFNRPKRVPCLFWTADMVIIYFSLLFNPDFQILPKGFFFKVIQGSLARFKHNGRIRSCFLPSLWSPSQWRGSMMEECPGSSWFPAGSCDHCNFHLHCM